MNSKNNGRNHSPKIYIKLLTKYKSENYNKTKKGKIMINKQELHDIFLKLRAGDTSQFELLYKNSQY